MLTRRRLVQDFGELIGLHLVELFLAGLQFLKRLHGGLRHATVRFIGATKNGELFTGGDAVMAVLVVETDAQQGRTGSGVLLLFTHAVTV